MRQKSVLLTLIKPVNLIHKDNRAPALSACQLGPFNRFADLLHAPQHGTDGDELGVKRGCHQPRDGGFSCAGWPPQNTAVRLTGLKRNPQRHPLAQQLLLTNNLAECFGSESLGQRLMGVGVVLVHNIRAG